MLKVTRHDLMIDKAEAVISICRDHLALPIFGREKKNQQSSRDIMSLSLVRKGYFSGVLLFVHHTIEVR